MAVVDGLPRPVIGGAGQALRVRSLSEEVVVCLFVHEVKESTPKAAEDAAAVIL